jgi:hypothetical protein
VRQSTEAIAIVIVVIVSERDADKGEDSLGDKDRRLGNDNLK